MNKEQLKIELHNLRLDIMDLKAFTDFHRCRYCKHLVNRGYTCLNCGYNNGKEYTREQIANMKAKSRRIKQ